MKSFQIGGASAAMLMLAMLGGCAQHPVVMSRQTPSITIIASSSNILTGDTTTIFAKTRNTLGTGARIHWKASFGRITPFDHARRAHFMSNTPGTAVISATIKTHRGRTYVDRTDVTVNRLK